MPFGADGHESWLPDNPIGPSGKSLQLPISKYAQTRPFASSRFRHANGGGCSFSRRAILGPKWLHVDHGTFVVDLDPHYDGTRRKRTDHGRAVHDRAIGCFRCINNDTVRSTFDDNCWSTAEAAGLVGRALPQSPEPRPICQLGSKGLESYCRTIRLRQTQVDDDRSRLVQLDRKTCVDDDCRLANDNRFSKRCVAIFHLGRQPWQGRSERRK